MQITNAISDYPPQSQITRLRWRVELQTTTTTPGIDRPTRAVYLGRLSYQDDLVRIAAMGGPQYRPLDMCEYFFYEKEKRKMKKRKRAQNSVPRVNVQFHARELDEHTRAKGIGVAIILAETNGK